MRTGLIGKKLGMTRVFDDAGRHVPVTVVDVAGCQVIAQRTEEANGYTALQLGVGTARAKNMSSPMRGHFRKANVEPKAKVGEFRVSEDGLVDVGAEIAADHFLPGQYVDVSGISIGKGFAGAMKRHNFSGLRATHGISLAHRSLGSTGQCQDPGRVFKGKKMAGHMGAARVTTQNLTIVRADVEEGLLLIRGAVPGSEGGWVRITDAVKKALPDDVPMPASLKTDKAAKAPSDDAPETDASEADVPENDATATEEAAAPEVEVKEDKAEEAKTEDVKAEETKVEDAPAEDSSDGASDQDAGGDNNENKE